MFYQGRGKLVEVNFVREVLVDTSARTFEIPAIDKHHYPSRHLTCLRPPKKQKGTVPGPL
jgi:hypothetical protein